MTLHAMTESSGELFWFKGTLVNIRVSWTTGTDLVSVIEHTMPYGDSPPLHIHRDEDEVFHILEGTIRFRIDGEDRIAKAGQTVLAPKGIPHTYKVETADGARCLTITTSGGFEKMLREMGVQASSADLPPHLEATPEMIGALTAACARNGIEIVGPPLF